MGSALWQYEDIIDTISVAFDMFDHVGSSWTMVDLTRLMQRASELFGLNELVLGWLMSHGRSSYLAL